MNVWNTVLDASALDALIPDAYARYRRPFRDALGVFLAGLPAAAQAAVLADQATLGPHATAAQRLAALARSCPVLHKIGQTLARDRRLAPELRRHLQDLESLRPSIPVATIRALLEQELGPLDRLAVVLEPPALAEASVAVVIPFRADQAPGGPRRGVFKVLKPGIEARLDQELQLLGAVGAHLDRRCAEFGLPHLDYQETFDQVQEKLRQEVRLDLEAQHLVRARAFYADEPRVLVPEPMPDLCTPRVTAMERVFGTKITEPRPNGQDQRRRLAGLVTAALVVRPVFARDGQALFHADPHAGNLLRTDDGRLALVDWSLIGALGARERTALVQIGLAATLLDAGRIIALLEGLAGGRSVDRAALASTVGGRLRLIRRGHVPGFAWLLGLLDEAVQTARLRVGADLMLFRKALHTLEGVVADLDGRDGRITAALQAALLRRLAAEWPLRWLAPPDCRAFATRLSNADLVGWMLSLPWVPARFWLAEGLDLLAPAPS